MVWKALKRRWPDRTSCASIDKAFNLEGSKLKAEVS